MGYWEILCKRINGRNRRRKTNNAISGANLSYHPYREKSFKQAQQRLEEHQAVLRTGYHYHQRARGRARSTGVGTDYSILHAQQIHRWSTSRFNRSNYLWGGGRKKGCAVIALSFRQHDGFANQKRRNDCGNAKQLLFREHKVVNKANRFHRVHQQPYSNAASEICQAKIAGRLDETHNFGWPWI